MLSLFLYIIFGLSAIALVHTYILYPLILDFLANNKASNNQLFEATDDLPQVSVLMAVYNEEKVISEKMTSLLSLNYPKHKLHIYIGSDCSSDRTNAIVSDFQAQDTRIHFFPFTKRRGKPGIINELSEASFRAHPKDSTHVLLLTDASVILQTDTLWHLIKHFANPEIAVVDSNMLHIGVQKAGISRSENQYITKEVTIKHQEGLIWGKMIGPFGGCYAIRSNYFTPVPPKFLVDDFYIAFKALEKGSLAINDLEAICFESVSHEIQEEYRRKSRISAGNFQNLTTFAHLLNLRTSLGFAFLSHKVLRWLGPFFILILLISSLILGCLGNYLFLLLFCLLILGLVGIPIFDLLLKKVNIHVSIVRNITYFIYMNIALLHGFINYLKGIKSNVWEPPKRN